MEQIHEADGVFQGGGVKGIGLVGALLEFYDRGYTVWKSVAGTSAGAIIAAYLACGHTPQDAADLLRRTPYPKFVDCGPAGKLIGGPWNFVVHRGFARGEYFRRWIDEQLEGKTFAPLKLADGSGYRLKLIAADITNREMLVLPDDLPRYRLPGGREPIDPDTFKIADAVRMSMSIPFFFKPVQLVEAATGRPAIIVDGGVLSNFPVWLFDVDRRDPVRPTFGFRLHGGRGVGGGLQRFVRMLGWPAAMGSDLFHTASDAWDKRFMSHSTRVRTCPVDAGSIGTTDFNLTPAQQQWLVDSGRRAAAEFLDGFSLKDYFNTYGRRLAPGASPPA